MDSQVSKHDANLKKLLNSWDLEHHYEHFVKERLTLKHLRIIQTKHIDRLFQNRPIGDQILFEHQLEIWKRTMLLNDDFSSSICNSNNINTTTTNNNITTHQTRTRAARKGSSISISAFNDTTQDMELLVPTDRNDSDDSCEEEKTDRTPHRFSISTPTPRVVKATPRSVPPAAVAPLSRHSHASSVPPSANITAVPGPVVPRAAVREPIQLASYPGGTPFRYNLMKILNDTSGGQLIVNYYKKHQHLREEHRTALINVIARYIDANGCTLTLAESNQLEAQIVEIFPTEKAEFYRTTKRGRLYNKISNMKRIYKKINKDIEDAPNTTSSGPTSPSSVVKEEEFVDDFDECYIQDMRAKAQITGDFLHFWTSTQSIRLKNIDEIEYLQDVLQKWPEYKETNIMEYISMDFAAKYPTATKFSQKFNDSIGKLEKLLFTKVSTCSAAFKYLQLYQKATKESQHLIILWVMHQIFPANHHMVMDENGVKRKKRFSIADSQKASICIRSSMTLIDNFLHNKEKPTPPMLLVVGELGIDIQEIFVYFEGIRYPMTSVADAAQLCLELSFLFNIDFPEEALLFYSFVQTYFLNIEPDVKNSKIYTTINDLNAY